MTDRLAGKTALVTGAATGIGYAVAARMALEGARVVFSDRDADGAAAAAERADGDTRAVTMDISDEASVEAAFAELAATGWSPDVVVANAGVQLFGHDAPAADLDLDIWRRTIDINLTGTFLTVKHAVRAMKAGGGGSIILTGSPTGLNGEGAAFTAYSASKAGIHGLARTVAAAYAADNIRVNTVIPAYTETSLARKTITPSMSAGEPARPSGMRPMMAARASGSVVMVLTSVVSV
jgi:NAD(P)-dependent dehydrogenase (short-subunit alcohol dehydrogenase family)